MKLFVGFVVYGESTAKYLSYFTDSLKESLSFLTTDQYSVVVFDNDEMRDNPNRDFLIKNCPNWPIMSVEKNLGFSAAYNRLIDLANKQGAQYFLMINPDILLDRNSIRFLIEKLDKDGSFAAVCPKLYHWDFLQARDDLLSSKTKIIDTCGLIVRPGLRFLDLGQGESDEGQYDHAGIIGPSGAAALFRMSALNKIKFSGQYLDEKMFMYKEDCDLAYRLFLGGLTSCCLPESIMWHDRSVSSPGLGFFQTLAARSQKSLTVRRWSFVNQFRLYKKYFSQQNLKGRFFIIIRASALLIFACLREPFLLFGRFSLFGIFRQK